MSRSTHFDWISRSGQHNAGRTRRRNRKLRATPKLQMESLEARQLLTTVGFTGDYALNNWTKTDN